MKMSFKVIEFAFLSSLRKYPNSAGLSPGERFSNHYRHSCLKYKICFLIQKGEASHGFLIDPIKIKLLSNISVLGDLLMWHVSIAGVQQEYLKYVDNSCLRDKNSSFVCVLLMPTCRKVN